MSKRNIEKSINDYVRMETSGKSFPTGWVLVASLAPPGGDVGAGDSYLTLSSDGLPVHTMMGLLELAQTDTRNISMLSIISSSIQQIFGKDSKGANSDGS